jgi:hypothetical protein
MKFTVVLLLLCLHSIDSSPVYSYEIDLFEASGDILTLEAINSDDTEEEEATTIQVLDEVTIDLEDFETKFKRQAREIVVAAVDEILSIERLKDEETKAINMKIEEVKNRQEQQMKQFNEILSKLEDENRGWLKAKESSEKIIADLTRQTVELQKPHDEALAKFVAQLESLAFEDNDDIKIAKEAEFRAEYKRTDDELMAQHELNMKVIAYYSKLQTERDESHVKKVTEYEQAKSTILNQNKLEEDSLNTTNIMKNRSEAMTTAINNFNINLKKLFYESFEIHEAPSTSPPNISTTTETPHNMGYQWTSYQKYQGEDDLPNGAVRVGTDEDGSNVYVIRGRIAEGEKIIGKFVAKRKDAYIANGDRESEIDFFEVSV